MTAPALVSLLRQANALAIGAAAGLAGARIGMPLPWMLGPLIGTTVAAMARVPIGAPAALRPVVIPVLGVLLGSSLSAEVLRSAAAWLPSLLLLPVYLAVSTLLAMAVYIRLGGFDRTTAFFSSVPGGITDMVIFSAAYGGDERRVALAHALRIFVTITFFTLFYGLVLGVGKSGGGRPWTPLSALSPVDFLLLGAAAVIGGALGVLLRIPAGAMMVPLAISAVLHTAGAVEVPPPSLLVNIAQLVLGASIGARFAGLRLRQVARDAGLGALATGVLLASAAGFAWVSHLLSGIPAAQTFLAFGPGGLSEMSLLALAMGQQAAYVSVSQIARIFLVILTAPLTFRFIRRG